MGTTYDVRKLSYVKLDLRVLEMTISFMERLSIILHYEKDAFASIILKEDCHESGKIH